MPKVGDTVDRVLILVWHVEPGGRVTKDEPVLTVETDKIEVDVPSPVSGRVVEILTAPEQEVAVGDPIMIVES